MPITGKLKNSISMSNTLSGIDLSVPTESVNQFVEKTVSSGVMYHTTIDLADAGTASIDLTDDSLSDVFGNTVAMVTVSGIYLKAASTNTTDITVTTGTNSIFPTLPAISAGEGFSYLSDIDVTTNGKLHFSNGAGAIASIDVIVTGVEA